MTVRLSGSVMTRHLCDRRTPAVFTQTDSNTLLICLSPTPEHDFMERPRCIRLTLISSAVLTVANCPRHFLRHNGSVCPLEIL